MKTKYVFVTGGVVSGLGKGITAASLGRLLKNRGYSLPTLKAINSEIREIKINRGTNESLSIKLNEGKWILNEEYITDLNIIENTSF